jgi:hypothetical protein
MAMAVIIALMSAALYLRANHRAHRNVRRVSLRDEAVIRL